MIQIYGTVPEDEVHLAFSGGKDSVAFAHYLLKGCRKVILHHINHNYTEDDWNQEKFVRTFAKKFSCPLNIHVINEKHTKGSREQFWRDHRYGYLYSLPNHVITGHHLQDQVETYLMGSIKGQPKFIPYQTRNIVRPFLLTRKRDILSFLEHYQLSWYEEESNKDITLDRNRFRLNILPEIEKLNPGIETTILNLLYKKIQSKGSL